MSQSNLALFFKILKKNRHKRILIGITQDAAMPLPFLLSVLAMFFQRAPPMFLKR
jgi:hypothetical protein